MAIMLRRYSPFVVYCRNEIRMARYCSKHDCTNLRVFPYLSLRLYLSRRIFRNQPFGLFEICLANFQISCLDFGIAIMMTLTMTVLEYNHISNQRQSWAVLLFSTFTNLTAVAPVSAPISPLPFKQYTLDSLFRDPASYNTWKISPPTSSFLYRVPLLTTLLVQARRKYTAKHWNQLCRLHTHPLFRQLRVKNNNCYTSSCVFEHQQCMISSQKKGNYQNNVFFVLARPNPFRQTWSQVYLPEIFERVTDDFSSGRIIRQPHITRELIPESQVLLPFTSISTCFDLLYVQYTIYHLKNVLPIVSRFTTRRFRVEKMPSSARSLPSNASNSKSSSSCCSGASKPAGW